MLKYFVFSCMLVGVVWGVCPRQAGVGHSRAPKSSGDNGFKLTAGTETPNIFIPGNVYTLSLLAPRPNRFARFILTTENKDYEKEESPRTTGMFQLFGDSITAFDEHCVNTIKETNDAPKSEIQVMWTAPKAGAGCVVIRAMVLQDRYHWYADEGQLSLEICEEKKNVLTECCACDEAKYKMVFEGIWSNITHPKDFPFSVWLTHFSDIVGGSHERDWTFWGPDHIATDGFRSLAEWGSARALDNELRGAASHLRTIIRAAGLWYPKVNSNTTTTFKVDRKRPQVSLVSMFGPSPDWVVGVSGLDLCQTNCTWADNIVIDLYPWDAGTDSGVTYMSPNAETVPRERMYQITTSYPEDPRAPFYNPYKKEMVPLARLYLTIDKLTPKSCDEEFLTAQIETAENTEDVSRPECGVTEWTDWSPCSVSCGKGLRMRTREYLMPQKAQMFECDRQIVSKEMCVAALPECGDSPSSNDSEEDAPVAIADESICGVGPWGRWSLCSSTCGKGVRMRTRHFVDKMGRKKCPHIQLVEKEVCMEGAECGREEPAIPGCPTTPWSDWSPCSVTCNRGVALRTRLLLVSPDKQQECAARVELVQQRPCDSGECAPLDMASIKDLCMQESDPGPCRGYFTRWSFEPKKLMCIPFIYGGCRGNRNNFLTADECNDVCQVVRNAITASADPASFNTQNSIPIVDCIMSEWTPWSACSTTCGPGISERRRNILTHPQNGGRACPLRVQKRRRCGGPSCPRT